MNKIKKKENIYSIIFFLFLLLIGITVFNDYGISIDEDNSRVNGFVSLKYILEIFNTGLVNILDNIITVPGINEYNEQGNGVIFDLPIALIETIFKVENIRDKYLIRHFSIFIIFFISLVFFFRLIKDRFGSYLYAFLGVLLIFLSPRIFANSFYNTKDICFMSLSIINLFYGFKFLNEPNKKNTIIFSLISGLTIGCRILGIYFPILIFLIRYIDILRERNPNKKRYSSLFIIIFLVPIFTILFWPYLWENPLENFLNVFSELSNHDRPISNFFLGNYISALYVPWNYILIWIFTTTPLFYLALFLLGLFFLITRIGKRLIKIDNENSYNDLWRGRAEQKDLIVLLTIIVPIISIIILHSSLYTGWRHLYFIYPSIVIISIYGLNIINLLYIKNKIRLFIITLILITPTAFWMVKNHPYQYVYFNSLVSKNFDKFFDMDYWGVSNYNSLKYLAIKNKKLISVGIIGNGDLRLSRIFLNEDLRKYINITADKENADFLIDNYNRWDGINFKKRDLIFEKKFIKYYEIKVNDISINTIYKNNFK